MSDEARFYEGRFIHTRRYSFEDSGIKRLLRSAYLGIAIDEYEYRFFRRCLERIARRDMEILDLGCGGGNLQLLQYGNVTGVDFSRESLEKARAAGYRQVVEGDISQLPFGDCSFDIVTSSHVLGHVPVERKSPVIAEMFRVTRPGGFSLHSVECDSNAWFYRRAKKVPALFQRYFVDMYGHHGLELPSANFSRFRAAGFRPVVEQADAHKGYLRPVESYAVFFDNEYRVHSRMLRVLAVMSRNLGALTPIRLGANCLLGMLAPAAGALTPADHCDSLKCMYLKPPSE